MPGSEMDIRPVTHITTDAIGQPGKRVFYLQGWQEERTLTLIVEKIQIQSLAVGYEQFLAELQEKFPDLPQAEAAFEEDKMRIKPPVDPLFRVGEMGLGYEVESLLPCLCQPILAIDRLDHAIARRLQAECQHLAQRA